MKKLMLVLLFPALLAAWDTATELEYTITGVVQDRNGYPVQKATIRAHGIPGTASTDEFGQFSIVAQDSCISIVVQSPYYVKVSGQACAGQQNMFKTTLRNEFEIQIDSVAVFDPETYEDPVRQVIKIYPKTEAEEDSRGNVAPFTAPRESTMDLEDGSRRASVRTKMKARMQPKKAAPGFHSGSTGLRKTNPNTTRKTMHTSQKTGSSKLVKSRFPLFRST